MNKKMLIFFVAWLIFIFSGSATATTRVFYDGFEDGTTNAWSQDDYHAKAITTTQAHDGTNPYAGSRMAEFNWDGAVAWNDPYAYTAIRKDFSSLYTNEVFIRMRVYFDDYVDVQDGSKFLRLNDNVVDESYWACQFEAGKTSASWWFYWEVNNSELTPLYDMSRGSGGTCRGPSIGTWHEVEIYIKHDTNGSDGKIRLWFDGVLTKDWDGDTHTSGGSWSPIYIPSNWSSNEGWEHDANNHGYVDEFEIFSDSSGGTATTGSMLDGTITASGEEIDTTPTQFTLTDITGATRSTVYTSNQIIVAGINSAATVTITNGTYSKNGGAYTSNSGTAVLGDTFTVRHTSSASYSTAVSTVLTIGGVSDTYTTTTLADPGDATPPVCTITYPTSSATYPTSSSTINISGTATDAVGVTSVTWANNRGGSGTATCTGCNGTSVTWSKTGIVLHEGENVITISASDAIPNTGSYTLTVTYTPLGNISPGISIPGGVTMR